MARTARKVTGDVDTLGETHHAAVIDVLGRQLADRQFLTCTYALRVTVTMHRRSEWRRSATLTAGPCVSLR